MSVFSLADGGLLLFADPSGGLLHGTTHTDVFVGGAGADTFSLGTHGGLDYILGFETGDHLRLAAPPWTINWHDAPDGTHVTYWGQSGADQVVLVNYHGQFGPSDIIIGA